jgi:predicted PurR-regulated permease PerM
MTGCNGMPNSVMLLKKIDSMISDNYTLLFVLLVVLIIVGLALTYFVNSISTTIKTYLRNIPQKDDSGDNPRIKEDDDNTYFDNPKEDPQYVDPNEYMPKGQKDYIKDLDDSYKEFNKLKTDYLKNTYNGRENDDYIDKQVLYDDHDDYTYD